jgi:hypothetical protein
MNAISVEISVVLELLVTVGVADTVTQIEDQLWK